MTDAKTHDVDFQGSFFALEVDALTIAWFTGCSGLSLEFDVATFKEGNGSKVVERKRPGKPKYSEDLPRFFAYAHKVAVRYNGLGPLVRLIEPLMGEQRHDVYF